MTSKSLPVLFLILTFATIARAEKKTHEVYWAETGLSTEKVLASHVLSNENCTQDVDHMEGCLAALNALSTAAKEPKIFIPDEVANDPVLKDFKPIPMMGIEPLFLLPQPKLPKLKTRIETFQRSQHLMSVERGALANYLADGRATKIDFEKLFKKMIPQVITQPINDASIAADALNAYLRNAEDAHAHIAPVEEEMEMLEHSNQGVVGALGAILTRLNGVIIVDNVIKNSPAEKAGLKFSDILLSINGRDCKNISKREILSTLHGNVGDKVDLKLSRDGKTFSVQLTLEEVTVPNVLFNLMNEYDQRFGYIHLSTFMDSNACSSVRDAIKALTVQKAEALILDLSNNPGGLVDQGVCIAGLFVGKKLIVSFKDLVKGEAKNLISDQDVVTNLPLAVLINARSASAAELVAGALQDYQRGWILGQVSFGKGTAQGSEQFSDFQKIVYHKTIRRFYQPLGHSNERVGITPDFLVSAAPDATDDDNFSVREDQNGLSIAADGAPWTQPRPQAQLDRLRQCVDLPGEVSTRFRKLDREQELVAFPTLAAEKVLSCHIR